jgi:anti-sigma-K factor RskA
MAKTTHPLDLLAAYAIGTLTETERADITTHLHTCAACRKELVKYETTVAKLSLATPVRVAPNRVKQRLMNKVRQQTGTQASGSPWWEAFFAKPAYAVFSVLVILALTASNIWLWSELNQRAQPPAPVALTVLLENTGKVDSGIATLVISNDDQHATLIVEQLPQLTPEQQYQLWLIEDGQPASAGVFTVSRDGYFALPVFSQIAFDSYAAFGVSIEPYGGSPAPTGDIVLYVDRSA